MLSPQKKQSQNFHESQKNYNSSESVKENTDVFSEVKNICNTISSIVDGGLDKNLIEELELFIYKYLLHNIGKKGRTNIKRWELYKMSEIISNKELDLSVNQEKILELIKEFISEENQFELNPDALNKKIISIFNHRKELKKKKELELENERQDAIKKAQNLSSKIGPIIDNFHKCISVINELELIYDSLNLPNKELITFSEIHKNWSIQINKKISVIKTNSLKQEEIDNAISYIKNIEKSFTTKVKNLLLSFIKRYELKVLNKFGKEALQDLLSNKDTIVDNINNLNNINGLSKFIDLFKIMSQKYKNYSLKK